MKTLQLTNEQFEAITKCLDYLVENEQLHYSECMGNGDDVSNHIYHYAIEAKNALKTVKEIKPKATKPKVDTLPDNWQGSGKYKLYDRATKEFYITDFEGACLHKGINPKKAFKVMPNTKDRPKDFTSPILIKYGNENLIESYVKQWLELNKLMGA